MISKRLFQVLVSVCLAQSAFSQVPERYPVGTILQKLEKLNTLGSVLYVAAHPDDENTQLIAYFANGQHYRTGYLSATRGDGGQNLVGPEIREALGVIRTQELLAARRVDGGEQLFSRANDFGYSRHPDETFEVWDRKKVLADFVWAIRMFRPDVIITRFSTEAGVTHGHHTASAILAREAFLISGDSSAFPEQLQYVTTWQPKKIFWNIGLWSYRMSGRTFDPTGYIQVDVGGYNTFLGRSYTEISALSRSMHKSQGFGNTGTRGTEYEYFEQWEGDRSNDLFGGINTRWSRIPGSEKVAYHINQARLNFDPAAPYAILPDLLSARKELLGLSDQYWKEIKLEEINELVKAVTGTYMEAVSTEYALAVGDSININFELINRSPAEMTFYGVSYSFAGDRLVYNMPLNENESVEISAAFLLPEDMEYSHPYWLKETGTEGMYQVADQQKIGLPDNPSPLTALVSIKLGEQFLDYRIPVVFKRNDAVDGEVYRPVEIVPDVMVNLVNRALVFGTTDAKKIAVRVIAGKDDQHGRLSLQVPEGWRVSPDAIPFGLGQKGDEQLFEFELRPPDKSSEASIVAVAEVGGKRYTRGKLVIAYDHLPTQTLFPVSETRVVKPDLEIVGRKIGYIMGAGDDIPSCLEQIGCEVTLLKKDEITTGNLRQFDAVILGIRAFNTVSWLESGNTVLFDYVNDGGTVIVQYNTSHALVTDELAPYPLKLSRTRVTVEEAPVQILEPRHEVLNSPNKITSLDFQGWVQERGLYFPEEWSEEFIPILSVADPGERPSRGGLLVARYGKGYYCYTGLSFFRELPAGVSGAYRLMANLISLGKKNEPK